MLKNFWLAPVMASFVFAAGCGGGGGGGGGSGGESGGVAVETRNDVAGPLDVLQGPVSAQLLSPLSVGVAGTPLEGVVSCLDNAIVGDVLDVVDALSVALAPGAGSASSRLNGAAPDVQAEVTDLVADLQDYVAAMGGGTGCSDSVAPRSADRDTVAGSSYASMAATLLPVLDSVRATLKGSAPGSLSHSQISALLQQVTIAFFASWGQVPEEAASATFVGTATVVIAVAVNDLQLATTHAASGDVPALRARLGGTLERLLTGLLVDVVPLRHIEKTSGFDGQLTGPVEAAVQQITQNYLDRVGTVPSAELASGLSGQIDALLAPVHDTLLPMIFGPVRDAIAAGAPGSSPGPTGTALDPTLVVVGEVVSGGEFRDPILSLLRGIILAPGPRCPLYQTPLEGICGIVGG